eukprot:sb/3473910/
MRRDLIESGAARFRFASGPRNENQARPKKTRNFRFSKKCFEKRCLIPVRVRQRSVGRRCNPLVCAACSICQQEVELGAGFIHPSCILHVGSVLHTRKDTIQSAKINTRCTSGHQEKGCPSQYGRCRFSRQVSREREIESMKVCG